MLDGLSRNSCQNSAKIQFLFHSMLFGNLGMHANAPRNFCCCLFSSARPLSCSLLFSQQEFFSSSLVLSTRILQLSCSWHLTKNLLASHQESLALSTRLLLLLLLLLLASHQDFCNFPVLGISPRTSWHLTKSLLLLLFFPWTTKNGCAHLP